jgi:hypothetical protein
MSLRERVSFSADHPPLSVATISKVPLKPAARLVFSGDHPHFTRGNDFKSGGKAYWVCF